MPPGTELVLAWLSKAADDLRAAEVSLAATPPLCWVAAFHAQQAAEKLLKGLLTFHGTEFEKSHSIDYLLDLCTRRVPEIDSLRADANKLTDYAVELRYPVPDREVSQAEAAEAAQIARHVRSFVVALLIPHLGDAGRETAGGES